MKRTKRGAKRIFVAMLAMMLVMESVSVPVRGEVKNRADAQAEMVSGQTLSESVKNGTEESVSANFVSIEETEVSANAIKKEDDETDVEMTAGEYSGIDGDLEWSIDSEGYLSVSGEGDYEKTPDWLEYKKEIKYAKISVQNITSMKDFFQYCSNLEDVVFTGTDMSQVTDLSGMFYGCSKLNGVDMRQFDTSKVTTMKGMFSSCKEMKEIDISMINMSQVTDLSSLFYGCSSLEKISLGNPDTSQVQNMRNMFSSCKKLEEIDVSELETVNVITMSSMFSECESLTKLDLSAFDLSKVAQTDRMFYNCVALETLDLGDSNLESLCITKEMFCGCKELQEIDLTKFDTTNVYDMEGMFWECRKVKELDVSHFKTAKVQSFKSMFSGCESVKELDVSGFETGNATEMPGMFSGCASVKKLDVSGFDTTKVYDMTRMFSGCSSLTDFTFGEGKNMQQVLSISSMFEGCKSLKTLELELYLPKVTRMEYFFKDCSSLKSAQEIDIDAFYLKNARGMFQGCSSLEEEMDAFNSLSVEDISYLYKDCNSLKEIKLPAHNAYRLTNIDWAFAGCSSLQRISFPSGEADNIERMTGVFAGCSSLKSVNLLGFSTPRVTELSQLFSQCSSLEKVQMEVLKNDTITSMFAVFEGCSSLQSINLSGLEPKENSFTRDNFKDCTSLIEIDVTPSMMQCLTASKYHNFDGCELFSEFHVSGANSEWSAVRPLWQNCAEKKVKYASVHLNDGTIEQTLQHEGSFGYIMQGGFGTQVQEDYVYNCDLSQFFGTGYNYNHNLGRMSIRVAMAAMSDNTNVNSSNIRALMDDLNLSKKRISYPEPEYNTIGYAMGTRRIYHNNQKKTLIMVAIRGGGYGSEWGGNANVGVGMEHEGFNLAANQVYWALNDYIGELKECNFIEGRDVVVWISGYSRGAATANLLASKLDDNYYMRAEPPKNAKGEMTEEHIMDVQASNVYAYCFECPQNTTNSYNNHSRYMNIFNIINPKDFVTYVAMNNGWDWRFKRYGKDLVLPDEANTKGSNYAGYYASMKNVYQAEVVPEIGANQSILARDAAKRLANAISKLEYLAYQSEVQIVAVASFTHEMNWWNFVKGLIPIFYNEFLRDDEVYKRGQLSVLADEMAIINKRIMHAHYPELCMAWMDSIPEEILLQQKSFWNIFVNCPVDIYVYEDENLVGCIKNDVPQQIENGVITMLDSNGQKQVLLPGDGEYKVVYKATDNGTMTISTSKYVQAETLPESVTGYYELPLKTGETYEAMITGSNFVLTDSTKTTVNPSVVQTGADVKTYKVDIVVKGNGEAIGINTYSVGEFAKVCAHPNEGEKFLGWYENETLISSEAEYRFCVKKDTTLTAKFTRDSQGEQNVAVGKLYKVNKHTYKVTSVKKKTVSFVKTASKSKTIKIPETVTIKGTKYKVTSVVANALKGNKKVNKVVIGNNVTSIGKKAFYQCTSLRTIIIPSKVKTIGESAFSGCKKLTKATIGKGVTKIGKKAFYNCKKLKAVTIKTTKLKSVGKYAFKGIAKKAIIKCPAKKVKKYRKILQKSKIAKTVQFK